MKRLVVLLILMLCSMQAVDTKAAYFLDVAEDDYYYEAVMSLYDRGIISGKGQGLFAPKDKVTRGQAAKMLANALELTPTSSSQKFSDVKASNGYYSYIQALVDHHIISGYSDGTFKPNAYITRNQMAKILANAYVLHSQMAEESGDVLFKDVTPSTSYYRDIQALSYYEITSPQTYYKGANYVTRGQMAAFINRAENTTVIDYGYFEGYDATYLYTSQGKYMLSSALERDQLEHLEKGEYINIYYERRVVNSILTEEENEEPSVEPDEAFNQATIHTSEIGLFDLFEVKPKADDGKITVENTWRNGVVFSVEEETEELSEWFTISGESYVYDYLIEVDVEVFYRDGQLQYDFHFEEDDYTLTAKDFLSERIVDVTVLNDTPIRVDFDGEEIFFSSTRVSAIPVQIKVETEKNGRMVTFYRQVFASADGRLHEDVYEPFSYFGLQNTQQVVDLEGADITERADFLYVHADFEGAKIPVLQDKTEWEKYGVFSEVGLPSEVGQHVIILVPEMKGIIWDEVRDDTFYVDTVPIPDAFSKVYAVMNDSPTAGVQDSYWSGIEGGNLHFGRNFFSDLYGVGLSEFVVTGIDATGQWINKKYNLTFFKDEVSLTESNEAPNTPIDESFRWYYEGNSKQLAEWLGNNSIFHIENIYEWNNVSDEKRAAFAEYFVKKYKDGALTNDIYTLLDFESHAGQANHMLDQLMENPYSLYENYVVSQLIARSSPSAEQEKVLTKYQQLVKKVKNSEPFAIREATSTLIFIDPALNDYYDKQTITIQQNGKTFSAVAKLDYPYSLVFVLQEGYLVSGPLKLTVKDKWGRTRTVEKDMIVAPQRNDGKDLGNNEIAFTYSDTITISDSFEIFVEDSEKDEMVELKPLHMAVEKEHDLIVRFSSADYEKYKQSKNWYITGVTHKYRDQQIEVFE